MSVSFDPTTFSQKECVRENVVLAKDDLPMVNFLANYNNPGTLGCPEGYYPTWINGKYCCSPTPNTPEEIYYYILDLLEAVINNVNPTMILRNKELIDILINELLSIDYPVDISEVEKILRAVKRRRKEAVGLEGVQRPYPDSDEVDAILEKLTRKNTELNTSIIADVADSPGIIGRVGTNDSGWDPRSPGGGSRRRKFKSKFNNKRRKNTQKKGNNKHKRKNTKKKRRA